MLTVVVFLALLALQAGPAYARQYRGKVHMRGPIRGRRIKMRAPIYRGRPNPHANAYNDQMSFNSFKQTWGTASNRYNWNYQFKNADSTLGYHEQGMYDQRGYYQE